MRRFTVVALAVVGSASLLAGLAECAEPAATPAPDRVVAIYFHRTQRCPTCQKMGSYAEEAVRQGFARQVKAGQVEFHYVDFQNKKNEALTKGYKVTGPALIVARVEKNQVKQFVDLEEIWTKVGEKPEFLKYVRDQVTAYSQ